MIVYKRQSFKSWVYVLEMWLSIRITISGLLPGFYVVEFIDFVFATTKTSSSYSNFELNLSFLYKDDIIVSFERIQFFYFCDPNDCVISPFILMDTFLVLWGQWQSQVFYETYSGHCFSLAISCMFVRL